MKKNGILLIIIVLFIAACENSEINPSDEIEVEQIYNKFVQTSFPNLSSDINFVDFKNGFAAANGGDVYRTNNSGDTWAKFSAPDKVDFGKIYAIDTNYWFCATKNLAENYIYKIENGEWTKINLPPTLENDFVSNFSFTDKNNGYIATSRRTTNSALKLIFKTEDGGQSWDTVGISRSTTKGYYPTKVFMADKNNGVAVHGIGFLLTNDGWETCKYITPENVEKIRGFDYPSIYNVVIIDKQHLIAVGGASFSADKGFICTSSDGGASWKTGFIDHTLRDVDITSDKVFVCGKSSYLAKSILDLNDFSAKNIAENMQAYTCSYDETSDIVTSTGKPKGEIVEFRDIEFPDDKHGFVSTNIYLFKINLK